MNKDYIYLDHAAATPMDPLVVEAMLPYFSEKFFNPSSPYAPAIFTKREYQDAKARLARCLGVMADELIMTAGATESVNLAFNAANGVSLISAIEHDSVINSAKARSEVKLIPPTKNGRIDPNTVKKMLTPDVGFVSIALVNHELGYIQPIEEISEILKDYPKVHFHVDGVQGVLKDKLDLSKVDSYAISAHKFHGIKGVGVLYLKSRRTVHNITFGGGQEDGLRSGTVNVAAAASLAKALRLSQEKVDTVKTKHKEFKTMIVEGFSKYNHIVINSPLSEKYIDSIINISLPKIKGEAIVNALNERGIMVSTTSACSSKTFHLNEALFVRGLSRENIEGSIRVSFSNETTKQEVETFIEVFIDEYNKKFKEVIESGI